MEINIIITGHKGHGKNTVCKILEPNFKSIDSSWFACTHFLKDVLEKKHGLIYDSYEECHADRINHRPLWADEIRDWNRPSREWNGVDGTRMSSEIFKTYHIYNGMRHIEELDASEKEGIVDYLIFVDASERLPLEGLDSMSIPMKRAFAVIDNNGPEENLAEEVHRVIEYILLDFIRKQKAKVLLEEPGETVLE